MSSTFLCFDCDRSVTFLHVGYPGSMRIISDRHTHNNVHNLTYVRCTKCTATYGNLNNNGILPYDSKFAHIGKLRELSHTISNFMHLGEWTVRLTTTNPSDETSGVVYVDIRSSVDDYIRRLACISLDTGNPTKAYDNFYN